MKVVRLSLLLSLLACMSVSLFAQTYSGGAGRTQGTPVSTSEQSALLRTFGSSQTQPSNASSAASELSKDQKTLLNLLWQQLTTAYGQLYQNGTPGKKTILSVANKMKGYLNIDTLNSIVPGLGDYVHQNFPGNTQEERLQAAIQFLNMQLDQNITNSLSLVFNGVIPYLTTFATSTDGCGGGAGQNWCSAQLDAAVMNWQQAEQYWSQVQASWAESASN